MCVRMCLCVCVRVLSKEDKSGCVHQPTFSGTLFTCVCVYLCAGLLSLSDRKAKSGFVYGGTIGLFCVCVYECMYVYVCLYVRVALYTGDMHNPEF